MAADDSLGNPEPAASPTEWGDAFRSGDSQAGIRLFWWFYPSLVRRGRRDLGPNLRARIAGDEDDLANSALNSFLVVIGRPGAAARRNRRTLRGLLKTIFRRKLCNRLALKNRPVVAGMEELVQLPELRQGDPRRIVEADDLVARALGVLDERNRQIARLHLANHSLAEIARRLDMPKATVAIRVQEIVKTWQRWYRTEAA